MEEFDCELRKESEELEKKRKKSTEKRKRGEKDMYKVTTFCYYSLASFF